MSPDDLESMLKADAFDRLGGDERAWLRSPDQVYRSASQLRIMVANLQAQLDIADTLVGGDRAEWRLRTERLAISMRTRLVEFEELTKGQDSLYRRAIERHRDQMLDEASDVDTELWKVLDAG